MSPADGKLEWILNTLADILESRAASIPEGEAFGKLERQYYAASDEMRTLAWAIRENPERQGTNYAEIPFDVAGEDRGAKEENPDLVLPVGVGSGGLALET